jgi:IS1 family transposase
MDICPEKKAVSEEDLENEYGRTWIWTALDVNSRMIISFLIGDRTLENCRDFLKDLSGRIVNKPLFVSDELPHYEDAIMESYHTTETFERTGKRGRPKKPIMKIDDEIDYAVVHKTRENGTVKKVETRIVFGTEKRVKERLENSASNKINTSYIERSNGTLRLNDAHLQRKTYKFSKDKELLKAKLAIIILFYNFIKPHATLSKNQDKTYTPRTPALAAGVVDSVWTTKFAFERPELKKNKYNN